MTSIHSGKERARGGGKAHWLRSLIAVFLSGVLAGCAEDESSLCEFDTPPQKKSVPRADHAPFKGAAEAKVVIQQFADFQCPYCAEVEKTLDEVMQVYGGQVRLEWRNRPLPKHPDAFLGAQAALEAFEQKGNSGFWAMHQKLFENLRTPQGLKREKLDGYAQQVGLDMDRWKIAMDNQTHKSAVEADVQAAESAGIQRTPGFMINDYFVSGAQPFSTFEALIDCALSE